jgi:hypothetical protein
VLWHDAKRRNPDPADRIWLHLAFFFIVDQFRWQELWRRWRRESGFSLNKAVSFPLWRLLTPVLLRGDGRSAAGVNLVQVTKVVVRRA